MVLVKWLLLLAKHQKDQEDDGKQVVKVVATQKAWAVDVEVELSRDEVCALSIHYKEMFFPVKPLYRAITMRSKAAIPMIPLTAWPLIGDCCWSFMVGCSE